MIEGKKCSNVVLKTRKIGKWEDVNTDQIFKSKKVILFSILNNLIQLYKFIIPYIRIA